MTVFTAEVAARRPSGFTIDSLIGNDKESGTSEKSARSKGSSEPHVRSNVPESPGPRVHRPTPIVSSTVVRPKAECSPCSALNLTLSAATSQQERVNLHNSKTHCDQPSVDGGPVFGVNYVDALSHPMVIRRGLPLSAQPNPQLWAHYSPDLHRNLSLNGPLFGRNPLRPPLPFTHGAGMMPFHPALISPPRDLFHPYHWNVRNQEGLPLPHLAGPGAGLFFHAFRKPKRHRTAFSPAQLLKLEHAFDRNQYVVGQERKALAEDLNLSETQVKVWFQNRRTKFKRVKAEGDPEDMDDSSANDTNCPIDNKVSHHVTRWKRDTNQVEVVDSDDEDNGSLVEEVEDQQMP